MHNLGESPNNFSKIFGILHGRNNVYIKQLLCMLFTGKYMHILSVERSTSYVCSSAMWALTACRHSTYNTDSMFTPMG